MRSLPRDLQMRAVDRGGAKLIVVRFDLKILGLTEAELDVGRAVARGASNRAVSRERRTSLHTVANQVVNILRKLELDRRAALATIPELLV